MAAEKPQGSEIFITILNIVQYFNGRGVLPPSVFCVTLKGIRKYFRHGFKPGCVSPMPYGFISGRF
ncbi:MAG TPA: hypothetical protein PLN48_01535, partial [Lachnospiraceae bacterium]|nr:hypothetical protein [Lachnospiraceae bacterium]